MGPKRDSSTPLILWICAAVCAHYMFGEGGSVVAQVHEDGVALVELAQSVRSGVRSNEQTFDVITSELGQAPLEPPKTQPLKTPAAPADVEKAPAERQPSPPPEPPKPTVAVKPDVRPVEPLPDLQKEERVAVRQHAEPNQADNPNARFTAERANHVAEETAATQTSHEEDDPNPTPGASHSDPSTAMGDSSRTKIADKDNHPGAANRAPGEKGTDFDVQHEAIVASRAAVAAARAAAAGGDGHPQSAAAAEHAVVAPAPGGGGPAAPDSAQSLDGNWTFNPTRPGVGTGNTRAQGPGAADPNMRSGGIQWLGLGGGIAPGGRVNFNLSQQSIVAVVGQREIDRVREADGERRRSEHRGSWVASGFEHWRSAIENYASSVKVGNQTALNTAASPFATYLNGMHNRIHPIFADTFLSSLGNLPPGHPLSDAALMTRLEIVLTRDGRVMKMGVVRTSGMTAFDIAALDSVQRASPFGPAPSAIVSPDGNVYLHWAFHRDEVEACATRFASPFLIAPVKEPPVDPAPVPPYPSRDRTPPTENTGETRHGSNQRYADTQRPG